MEGPRAKKSGDELVTAVDEKSEGRRLQVGSRFDAEWKLL
jgi:hypothetical protein